MAQKHLFCCPSGVTVSGRRLSDGESVVMYVAFDVETPEHAELVRVLDAARVDDPARCVLMWSYVMGLQSDTLEVVESEHGVGFGGESFASTFPPGTLPEHVGVWTEVDPDGVAALGPVIAHDATVG